MPDVYDKEKTTDGSHDDLGVHPERREAEVADLENLYNADSAETEADEKEKAKLDDQVGSGYRSESSEKKAKVKGSGRRKGIIASILVTGAVGAGGLGFLSAPNFIVNHLRERLLSVSDLQTYQSRRYRRSKISNVKDMFTRDGRRANKLITDMQRRGYQPRWSPSDRNRLIGFSMPNGTGIIGLGTTNHIEDHINRMHPLRTSRWKTKQMNAVYERYGIPRKSVVISSLDLDESAETVLNRRMAETVIDDDPESIKVRPAEAASDDEAAKNDANNRNQAAQDIIKNDGSLEDVKNKIKRGESISNLSPEERAILRVGIQFDDELIELINRISNPNLSSRFAGSIKSFGIGIAADMTDRVCIVKGRLRMAMFAARNYRALSLMRYTSSFIAASDQTRIGEVDPKMMNELMKRVMTPDDNGMSIGSSVGFAYMGGKFSKSKNDASKSPYSIDGSLTGISLAAHKATDGIPGTTPTQCRVWQNPATQIGAGGLELAVGFFTGGSGKAAAEGVKVSVRQSFSAAFRNMISKQTLKSIGKTALISGAIELSFEGIMMLLQMQAERALHFNFTGQERGAELGNILVAGSGTMNKQRSLQAGMVPATAEQYAMAQNEYIAWKNQETAKQSLFTKILDYSNPDSLAFRATSEVLLNSPTPGNYLNDISSNVASLLSQPLSVFSGFSNILLGTANAQDNDLIEYDQLNIKGKNLATDHAGNLLPIMRSDIEAIDPQKNIEELASRGEIESSEPYAPKSENFKEHVKNCVESVDTLSILDSDKDQSDPKFDCLATQPITVKYKAHLAYLDMVDGVDAMLFPEEISEGQSSGAQSPNTPNTGGMIVGDPYTDTTSVECAEGTKDIGLHDAYVDGKTFKSRMCSLLNLPSSGSSDNPGSRYSTPGAEGFAVVNSRVSGAWKKLIDDARAAGIDLRANSSFRSMEHQQALFAANPNTSLVARPGYSSHQAGVAIDFSNMGGKVPGASCANRATNGGEGYRWLKENAIKYGFKQYAAEAWHWDALPTANRC